MGAEGRAREVQEAARVKRNAKFVVGNLEDSDDYLPKPKVGLGGGSGEVRWGGGVEWNGVE